MESAKAKNGLNHTSPIISESRMSDAKNASRKKTHFEKAAEILSPAIDINMHFPANAAALIAGAETKLHKAGKHFERVERPDF